MDDSQKKDAPQKQEDSFQFATEGEQWRISLDDLEDDTTLDAGSPSVEHALFVVLGAAVTVVTFLQFL
ncbi:DUF7312 domain-containing protein [Natronomonas sp. EA1]|uniref:DUF7312 domain-containing protein n=1 Tax=Natronomonas sp. EA1 TaxID=3421655 RepID=UPI003EBD31F6